MRTSAPTFTAGRPGAAKRVGYHHRRHVESLEGAGERVDRRERMRDGEFPLDQIERKGLDPGHGFQPVADQPLLGRTVHVLDQKDHTRCTTRRRRRTPYRSSRAASQSWPQREAAVRVDPAVICALESPKLL